MPRIAIIDNSIDPLVYRPVAHWNRWLGGAGVPFEARSGRFPRLEEGFSHLILTGSEASILERAPWAEEEVVLVRQALDRGLAILGSCYGHQLLALAIGGPAFVRRCREPEIGWPAVEILRGDPLLGPPRPAHVFNLHFDEVADPEGRLTVLARTPVCPVHAFRYGDRPVWGVQSHPEIDPEEGRRLLAAELEGGFPGERLLGEALRAEPRDDGLIHPIIEAFLGSRPGLSS